jgi:phosphomethylpyrimidine synthase
VRDYAAILNDPNSLGTLTQKGVIEDGMAEMSEKFRQMGEQVYVDAEKVKESNRTLT